MAPNQRSGSIGQVLASILGRCILLSCVFLVSASGFRPSRVFANREDPIPFALVITGGELLSGVYADQHTLFLTRKLTPLGLQCKIALQVGDRPQDLRRALEYAQKQARLVVVTGGLGPTNDDVTRDVVSDFMKIPLQQDPAVLAHLERRLAPSQPLRQNLARQTQVPTKGGFFDNPNGTAVGLVFEGEETVVVALPGPPGELRPMVEASLIPYLAKKFGTRSLGVSTTMRFVGIGESRIDEVMREVLDLPEDLMISSLFEGGRVDLTFSLPRESTEEKDRLALLKGKLLERLRPYLYSDTGLTLEEAVLAELRRRDLTLSVLEVGSGGMITSALFGADMNSEVMRGGHVVSSRREVERVLAAPRLGSEPGDSEEPLVAEKWARAVAHKDGSKWGLAVWRLSENEVAETPLWVAIATEGEVFKRQRFVWPGASGAGKARLVTAVLDFLRRSVPGN